MLDILPFYLRPVPSLAGSKAPLDWFNLDARIAGRKRYPARGAARTLQMAGGEEGNGVEATATFLDARKDGPRFTGEIRFHNLRPVELGALVWAITWGDPTGKGAHRHMLGRAKAFGYGQVRARITSSEI